jgi:hypothetical protein
MATTARSAVPPLQGNCECGSIVRDQPAELLDHLSVSPGGFAPSRCRQLFRARLERHEPFSVP